MRTDVSAITAPLRQSFANRPRPDIHELEPGNSMMLGYPDSPYGHNVYLLTGMAPTDNGFTAFHVNGPRCSSLSAVVKEVFKREIDPAIDQPVFAGGADEANRIFILTPHDWCPEIDNNITVGPYRVHNSLSALHAFIEGERPDRVRFFCGITTGSFKEFKAALCDNMMGEITATDDLIFTNYDAETKWQRALYLHTGGGMLCVPQHYEGHSLIPEKDGERAKAPHPFIN